MALHVTPIHAFYITKEWWIFDARATKLAIRRWKSLALAVYFFEEWRHCTQSQHSLTIFETSLHIVNREPRRILYENVIIDTLSACPRCQGIITLFMSAYCICTARCQQEGCSPSAIPHCKRQVPLRRLHTARPPFHITTAVTWTIDQVKPTRFVRLKSYTAGPETPP